MISLSSSRIIIGYHGCDKAVADKILRGEDTLIPSSNKFDWLGGGIYFWEHSHTRALAFANEQKIRSDKKGSGKFNNPTVLGAMIHLGHCFDLTDVAHTTELQTFYPSWLDALQQESPSHQLPTNQGTDDLLLRFLDCAVLNTYFTLMDEYGPNGYYYQTVRGVFIEGAPVYPGAAIRAKTHIQIAVRDPRCILGYFLPTNGVSQP